MRRRREPSGARGAGTLRAARLGVLVLLALASSGPAAAWHGRTHRWIAEAAAGRLPESMPPFLRRAADDLGRAAIDPDVWRHDAAPALAAATRSDHYFSLERLGAAGWPERRDLFLLRLGEGGRDAGWIGTLPLAVAETSDRLALAFAQHRCWPDDRAIQARAIEHAGVLAHFAADLVQPLHTTIHHDGRALADGTSPGDGSHLWSDRLIELSLVEPLRVARRVEPLVIDDVARASRRLLRASHARVARAYAMVARVRQSEAAPPRAVRRYARERFRTGVGFVAGLWVEAWRRSATIELPEWLAAARGGGAALQAGCGVANDVRE